MSARYNLPGIATNRPQMKQMKTQAATR